jgi:hypothetical protein
MEAHKAKKLAKQVAATELGSAKKLPKTLKGEREELQDPSTTLKVGKEGHKPKRDLPREKLPRTTSKWWNNLVLLLFF